MDPEEIKSLIEEQGSAFEGFKDDVYGKLQAEIAERQELEARINRQGLSGTAQPDAKTMNAISDVLRKASMNGNPSDVTAQLAEETKATSGSTGVDPSGGYAVIPEFDSRIRSVARDQGAMRQVASVRNVSSDAYEYLINHGNVAGTGWVGETESRSNTDTPLLKKASIPVQEIYSNPRATQRIVDDAAVNLGEWLVGEVGLAFGEAEASAFMVGDGIHKPRGVTTYPTVATSDASRAYGKFEHIATGASGAFNSSDPADALINTVYKLKAGYRRNARWIMSSEVAGEVRKMKDGMGRFLWQEAMREGEPALLLGFPVSTDEYAPAIASNSLSIAFGDFRRGYQIVDRQGIKVLVDPYTDKPFIRYYSTMRVGGDVVDFNAIKFVKFSAS